MSMPSPEITTHPGPRWQPVNAVDRRVLGVLVEKAKTTPDAYPLSINAIVTGANQKNNRAPITNLEDDQVQMSVDRLRKLGAVAEVQSSGRVPKYRHFMQDWLGVSAVELAVMAELLLRGPQTEGDLRGRAARMEPIADVAALRPIIDSLQAKLLMIPLTPAGRGQIWTHALYEPHELERIREKHGAVAVEEQEFAEAPRSAPPPVEAVRPAPTAPTPPQVAGSSDELASLRNEVRQLRQDLDDVTSQLADAIRELNALKDALGH